VRLHLSVIFLSSHLSLELYLVCYSAFGSLVGNGDTSIAIIFAIASKWFVGINRPLA
jgi:hypothetical protein